jgi:hypothetical protein
MDRFWTATLVVLSMSLLATAKEPNELEYGDLDRLATSLIEDGSSLLARPRLLVYPSAKGERDELSLSPPDVEVSGSLVRESEGFFVEKILEYMIATHAYKNLFRHNATLMKLVKEREKAAVKMIELIKSRDTRKQKTAAFETLVKNAEEIESGIITDYAKEKSYKLKKPEEFSTAVYARSVTLVTDPSNGVICMVSALDYQLYKLNGLNADAELAKHVLAKTEDIGLSGTYYYLIKWKNGKKSDVGTVKFKEPGKYTLADPVPGV